MIFFLDDLINKNECIIFTNVKILLHDISTKKNSR